MRDSKERERERGGEGSWKRQWQERQERHVKRKELKGKQCTEEMGCCAISLIIDCLCVCVWQLCAVLCFFKFFFFFLSHPQSHTVASMHDWWPPLTPASPGLSVLSEEPPGLIAKGTLEMNHGRKERGRQSGVERERACVCERQWSELERDSSSLC